MNLKSTETETVGHFADFAVEKGFMGEIYIISGTVLFLFLAVYHKLYDMAIFSPSFKTCFRHDSRDIFE